ENVRSRNLHTRRAMLTAAAAAVPALAQPQQNPGPAKGMDLGVFSVSLAVKDIEASRKFYEKLGFRGFAGNASRGMLIMPNGDTIIGLFQGMFEKNILTFNPGWDNNTQKKASFTDVRDLQRQLKAAGMQIAKEADETTKGPAAFVVYDPDGNQILVDQHV